MHGYTGRRDYRDSDAYRRSHRVDEHDKPVFPIRRLAIDGQRAVG